jgi:hypothetical protein
MTRLRPRAAFVALTTIAAVGALPSAAFGQATRTWVSGVGDDANPCSRTAPCKTFAGAISKTAAKGEINVLDPGGFGAVTITKSIHIRARGNTAGVLTNAANAINVSAGVNDRVTLSGLDINGLDTAANGVKINSGKVVRIENSQIYGFATAGVSFTPSTANARLIIDHTIIHDNPVGAGVATLPTAAGGAVTIRNSAIEDNSAGVAANGTTAQPAVVNVFRSSISDNTTGLLSFGANADIRIGSDDLSGNTTAMSATTSGKITTFGNNQFSGNGSDGASTNSIAPK